MELLELLSRIPRKVQKAYLHEIFDGVAEGLIVINADCIIEAVNARAEELFGWSREAMIGHNVSMLMPESYARRHDGFVRHYLDTGQARIIGYGREVTGLRKSGDEFPMGLAVSEVKVDGVHHFIGIVRDLSARKALERHLLQARDDANRASTAKSAFLANMSHELRTPLNSIIGFAGILRDGLAGELNAEQQKQISIIHESGKHLLDLINDILDLSKVDAGRMNMEPTELCLADVADEILNVVRPLADKKQLSLEQHIDKGIRVIHDPTRVRQLLLNLLSNAVKFTEMGGIIVRADASGRGVVLQVEDTGIGIDAADLEHVFDEFKQVGSRDKQEEGTGLGLALCQRIVGLMGGEISVQSEPGRGTVFRVDIPVEQARGPADVAAGGVCLPDGFDAAKPTLLAIDDDASMLELLRRYLVGTPYQLIVAGNGEAGVEAAETYRPSAVLLDILMPGISGWEVLSQLQGRDATADIPVICISVLDDRETAYAMGAAELLTKPILREQLIEALGRHLEPWR